MCKVVYRQTGQSGYLHIYMADPAFGIAVPSHLTAVTRADGSVRDSITRDVDAICRCVQQVNRPAEDTDRLIARAKADEEYAEQEATNRQLADRRKDAEKKLRRMEGARGMSSKFRPSVLVDGFKGV